MSKKTYILLSILALVSIFSFYNLNNEFNVIIVLITCIILLSFMFYALVNAKKNNRFPNFSLLLFQISLSVSIALFIYLVGVKLIVLTNFNPQLQFTILITGIFLISTAIFYLIMYLSFKNIDPYKKFNILALTNFSNFLTLLATIILLANATFVSILNNKKIDFTFSYSDLPIDFWYIFPTITVYTLASYYLFLPLKKQN